MIPPDEKDTPTLKGAVTKTQDGFDKVGNPKINVNIKVPAASLFARPGKVE